MKLILTPDEIKNHYREIYKLDQTDEIVIEFLSTKLNVEDVEKMVHAYITSKLKVEDAEKMEDLLEKMKDILKLVLDN
jgi:hypothetical protein